MDNNNSELTNQIHNLIHKIKVLINTKAYTTVDISSNLMNLSQNSENNAIYNHVPNYLALTIQNDYKTLAISNIISKTFRVTLKVLFGTFILNILKFFL